MTLQCNGNDLGDSDAYAFEREVRSVFRKQKKLKVFETERREFSTSKSEEKSRTKCTVTRIIDRSSVEREYKTKEYRVKRQSQAEFAMIRKQVSPQEGPWIWEGSENLHCDLVMRHAVLFQKFCSAVDLVLIDNSNHSVSLESVVTHQILMSCSQFLSVLLPQECSVT